MQQTNVDDRVKNENRQYKACKCKNMLQKRFLKNVDDQVKNDTDTLNMLMGEHDDTKTC